VLANGSGSEIGQLEADLRGRWRQATRAVMVLLSAHGLPPAQIAALLDCHRPPCAAGSAGSTMKGRPGRPTGPGPGGQRWAAAAARRARGEHRRWVYRLGRRCAADFIALLDQLLRAFPWAPVIAVICDDDSIHHARKVTAYLEKHPRLELVYGARYSTHDNPAEVGLSQCRWRWTGDVSTPIIDLKLFEPKTMCPLQRCVAARGGSRAWFGHVDRGAPETMAPGSR
jgi:DDE superfamily endonuclease